MSSAVAVVVIGGGPAGLTAAYELTKRGARATVLEASADRLGGLARTERHLGFLFDIGGHRFYSKSQEIEDLWTELLGDEMLVRGRLSRIYYHRRFFDYPLRAVNVVRNLGAVNVALALASYVTARLRPIRNPRSLEDWTVNAFGRRLYETFFKTYTEKVWGIPCSEISADWAAQRIKGLSMLSLLKATLLPKRRRQREKVIKTLIDTFRYPLRGPGQMWETCARKIEAGGNEIRMDRAVTRLNWCPGALLSVETTSGASGIETVPGTHFLSSMPIRELVAGLEPPASSDVRAAAEKLAYRDFLTVALVVEAEALFPDNWIYIHDSAVRLGRVQNFKNWSPAMVPDGKFTCLGLEYFCNEGDDLWSMPDPDLVELGAREIGAVGLVDPALVRDGCVVRVKKAYPVYDAGYADRVAVVRRFLDQNLPNLQLIGRNGMHKYNNQDHSMMTALLAARNILGAKFDVWKVNSDAEYHEDGIVRDSARSIPERLAPVGGSTSV